MSMATWADKPTGVCKRCSKPLDDHVGWFEKGGPFCPIA